MRLLWIVDLVLLAMDRRVYGPVDSCTPVLVVVVVVSNNAVSISYDVP